jgi:hypothetical protein
VCVGGPSWCSCSACACEPAAFRSSSIPDGLVDRLNVTRRANLLIELRVAMAVRCETKLNLTGPEVEIVRPFPEAA